MHHRILAVAMLSSACTRAAGSKDSAEDAPPSPGDSGANGTSAADPVGTLSGEVVDATGSPLEGATVNLCREVCKLARTDASGRFSVEATDGIWALEVVVTPADPASGWATPLVPVEMQVDVHQTLASPLVVPMLDAVVPLTEPGPLELTPGFILTADPDEWEAPVLTPSAEPWLGATAFDFATSGLPLLGLTGEILGAWHVAPTASHPDTPWPLSLHGIGLTEGERAEVWVSDYATQSWLFAGEVTNVEDGGPLDGAALPTLGTVLLLHPSDD